MNLEAFLARQSGVGELDSQGAFTATMTGQLDRMSDHLLADSGLAPLVAVAGAVAGGARALDIGWSKREVVFRFALDQTLPPATHHLLLAAAVWRRQASRVALVFPAQGRELVLTPRKVGWEPCPQATGDVQLSVVGKVPGRQALELQMLRHCGLCPIPLSLDGKSLQVTLDKAYGATGAWSETVPDHLRPAGKATLEGELALVLAPTSQARPGWVAVVGGISYPFLLPEAGKLKGVVWSPLLSTDLGLGGVVCDRAWTQVRQQVLRQASRSGLGRTKPGR